MYGFASAGSSLPSDHRPTAVQSPLDGHETAPIEIDVVPTGTGSISSDQVWPSQESANAGPVPPRPGPAAVHAITDEHETGPRAAPGGAGIEPTDQLLPFQVATQAPPVSLPTTTQSFAVGHDTPLGDAPEDDSCAGDGKKDHVVPSQIAALTPWFA